MLLKANEVPEYIREDSISTGYRKQTMSYKTCFTSLFHLHNETVNIWSHLLGFFIFLYCLCKNLLFPPENVKSHFELTPMLIQLVCYLICLLSSALFHTFSCLAESPRNSWLKFDHLGVLVALFGSYVAFICDTFNCLPGWKHFHISCVGIILLSSGLYSFLPKFNYEDRSKIKLEIFIILGLYCTVPFFHWIWIKGDWQSELVQEKIQNVLVIFLIGGLGLSFYVTKFPERISKPGAVDIVGASHQVWHLFVFTGMVYWYLVHHSKYFSQHCSNEGGIPTSSPESGEQIRDLSMDIIWSSQVVKNLSGFFDSISV